jgi:nitrite reductase/ring-hydroxylating ferredoxin subunit
MHEWKRIAELHECPPGSCLERVIEGRIIALFNVEGEFYALDGICPHQGGPLGKGRLAGTIVTCPWHGWQFDVRDGQNQLSRSLRQPSLPTKNEHGVIHVALPAHETDCP